MTQAQTKDALLDGRVRIAQPVAGYRAAIDPVVLAAAIPDRGGLDILDVGCGDGAATLCLAWRLRHARVHGLDLRADAIERLEGSVAANAFAARVTGRVHDIAAGPPDELRDRFDWVVSNPPYLPAARADQRGPGNARGVETVETVPLLDWLDFMLACTADGGHVLLVHRADRIDELLAGLARKTGDVLVAPLWPHAGVPAKRVIIRARKNAKGPATLHPGLVLHDDGGEFTPPARAILFDGQPFDLS